MRLMERIPGAVTPLGLPNDRECAIVLHPDEAFSVGKIGVRPNDDTAAV